MVLPCCLASAWTLSLSFILLLFVRTISAQVKEERGINHFELNKEFLLTLEGFDVTYLVDRIPASHQASPMRDSSSSSVKNNLRERDDAETFTGGERARTRKKLYKKYFDNRSLLGPCKNWRTQGQFLEKLRSHKERAGLDRLEEMSNRSCIIQSFRARIACCEDAVLGPRGRKMARLHRYTWFESAKMSYCMELYNDHSCRVMNKSVPLEPRTDSALEEELESLLLSLPSDLQPDASSFFSLLTTRGLRLKHRNAVTNANSSTRDRTQNEKIAELVQEKKRTRSIQRMASDSIIYKRYHKRLNDFLLLMKTTELSLMYSDDLLQNNQSREYIDFMHGFKKLHSSSKTGVYYNAMEGSYMTCSLINYRMYIKSSYCSYLKLVDDQAEQLRRPPVRKWESGRMMSHTDSSIPRTDKLEARLARQRLQANKQRTRLYRRGRLNMNDDNNSKNVRLRRAVWVDLLGSAAQCDKANLAYGCYAFCCDSFFTYSQFCSTENLSCIS